MVIQLLILHIFRLLLLAVSSSTLHFLRFSRFLSDVIFVRLNAVLTCLANWDAFTLSMLDQLTIEDIPRIGSNAALTELVRFERTVKNGHPSERASCLRDLLSISRTIDLFGSEELWQKFFQIIYDMGQDDSCTISVRCTLLEQMPYLYSECRQSTNLNNYVDPFLTALIISQLSSDSVRKTAIDVIAALLEQRLFSQDSLQKMLLPTLFHLIGDAGDVSNASDKGYSSEEIRMEICTVLCRVVSMSNVDDRHWLFHNFLPKYSYFLADSAFHIRKAAVSIFGHLAQLFGERFAEVFLVRHLVALIEDSQWGVRKTVCEVFVSVALYCSLKTRREVLVPLFMTLLEDKSRWVSYVAYQELGPFIATFADGSHTGLALCDHKVCEYSGSSSEDTPDDTPQEFRVIPSDCYLPEAPEQSTSLFDQLNVRNLSPATASDRLFMLLDQWKSRNEDPAHGCVDSVWSSSAAATGKCSSSDDLSKIGLDDDDMQIDDEDNFDLSNVSDGPMNCTVLENSQDSSSESLELEGSKVRDEDSVKREEGAESPIPLTYWTPKLLDIPDDLIYFGSSLSSEAKTSGGDSKKNEVVMKEEELIVENNGEENGTTPVEKLELPDMDISDESLDLHMSDDEEEGNGTLEMLKGEKMTEKDVSSDTDSHNTTLELLSNRSVLSDTTCQEDTVVSGSDHNGALEGTTEDMDISTGDVEPDDESQIVEPVTVVTPNGETKEDSSALNDTIVLFSGKSSSDTDADLFPNPCGSESKDESGGDLSGRSEGGQGIVPQQLVNCFLRMDSGTGECESDYNRHRAHNFPAVAFTLGRANWKQLRDTYQLLAKDSQWKVRASLAASLHDMAAIIGPKNTSEDLLPVFNKFREDVEEVRAGLLTHLYEFYERLDEESRLDMLNKLPHVLRIDNEANWRFRKEFASQCNKLCSLYSVEAINRGIAGIALTLCTDRVADVREESSLLTARILGMMVDEEWIRGYEEMDCGTMPFTESFVQDIVKGFARSRTARRRQTFALICELCLIHGFIDNNHFSALLLDHITLMANDKVPNVRLCVCRVLTAAGRMISDQSAVQVEEAVSNLLVDGDMDVARAARMAKEGCEGEREERVCIEGREERIKDKEEEYFTLLSTRSLRDDNSSMDMSICDVSSA